jgi:hypothetical protein
MISDDIDGAVYGGVEGFEGLYDVVGWHHEHDGIGVAIEDFECCESDAGGGIPGGGFHEQIADGEYRELLESGLCLNSVGDDPGVVGFGP